MSIINLPIEQFDSEKRIFIPRGYRVESGDCKLESVAAAFRKTAISMENYVGKNNTVLNVSSSIGKIQKLFQGKVGKELTQNDIDSAERMLKSCEKIMEKGFGIETVHIQITNEFGINSVPVTHGDLNLEKYQDMSYVEALNAFTETVEDAQGIRFKDPSHKYLVIIIGVPILANTVLSDVQLTAVLFHEIGHSFINHNYGMALGLQRLIFGIDMGMRMAFTVMQVIRSGKILKGGSGEDLDDAGIVDSMKFMKWLFDSHLEEAAATGNPNLPMNDETKSIMVLVGSKMAAAVQEFVFGIIAAFKIITIFWKTVLGKKDKMKTEIEKVRVVLKPGSTVEPAIKNTNEFVIFIKVFFIQIWMLVGEFISFITTKALGFSAVRFFINRLISTGLFPMSHVNKHLERKSDDFAKAFGLGPELAESLIIIKKQSGSDKVVTGGINTVFNYIPVVRILTQSVFLGLETMTAFAAGYPSDRNRIKAMYNSLRKDLDDPSIPKKLKGDIIKDIERLERTYSEYIDPSKNSEDKAYAKSFFYMIFHSLLKLKNDGYTESTPPSNVAVTAKMISTFRSLRFMIPKMKPEDEAGATEILEKVSNESCMPIYDGLEGEVTWESKLPDEAYAAAQTVTMEAYFGKVEIVQDTINYIHQIRELLPKKAGKIPDSDKATIRGILDEWGKKVSDHFNSEDAYIGLESCYNAYAVSFICGNSVERKAISKSKLVETPTGYKYETKDNIHIIMMLGLPLITDPKLSDETLTAIMFHEIGHGFQHFKVTSIHRQKSQFITKTLFGQVKDFIYKVFTLNIFGAIGNIFDTLKWVFTGFGLGKSRKHDIADGKSITDDTLDTAKWKNGELAESGSEGGGGHKGLIASIIGLVQSLLITLISWIPLPGITSFAITILYDPLFLVDLFARGAIYRKNKECELFADNFSMKYGLGLAEAEFFYNMYTAAEPQTTEFPLLRMVSAFNMMGAISILGVCEEHPSDRVRIKKLYEGLAKELEDRNLPPAMRAQMKKDLEEIKITYNDLISPGTNFKEKRRGQAVMWLFMRVFVKLKERAKTKAELEAPVNINGNQAMRYALAAGKENPDIIDELGESQEDYEARFQDVI